MRKVVGFVLGLLPVYAFAECVPVPDCASIGYTETSCDGDSLKCPFDNTKLKCFPCDSSFRFSCEGNNIVSAVGDACNGKYVSCGCVAGAEFINGECVCNNSCDSIGNIVYSDKTCSSCVNNAKMPIAVVIGTNLVISTNIQRLPWASGNIDVNDIANLALSDAVYDMQGYENSKKIRETYIDDDATNNAAWFCYDINAEGFENKKGEWYLPAAGEIYNYLHLNHSQIKSAFNKLNLFYPDVWLVSSSENNYQRYWITNPLNGSVGDAFKTHTYWHYVGCLLNCDLYQ